MAAERVVMDVHTPLTIQESTISDHLTGLESGPLDAVTPVHVEILDTNQDSEPDASLDLDELRQTIARAEARISSVRELQEQLNTAQQRLQELEQERDHLQRNLSDAQAQLAEVRTLQQQLQRSLAEDLSR